MSFMFILFLFIVLVGVLYLCSYVISDGVRVIKRISKKLEKKEKQKQVKEEEKNKDDEENV